MQRSFYSESNVSRHNTLSRNSSHKALTRNASLKSSRNASFKATRRNVSLKAVSRPTSLKPSRNATFKALNLCNTSHNASFNINNSNHDDYNASNNSSFFSICSNDNNTHITIKNSALHRELHQDINLITTDDSPEKRFLFSLRQDRWSAKNTDEKCSRAMSKPRRHVSRDSLC